jgi:hypothetical protein
MDEDAARRSLAMEFRARGADVVIAIDVGAVGQSDGQQLEWAAANSPALYSFNRGDFFSLHTVWMRAGRSHSGVILSRQGLSVGEQMRRLLRLIDRLLAEEMRDRVEFLGSPRRF